MKLNLVSLYNFREDEAYDFSHSILQALFSANFVDHIATQEEIDRLMPGIEGTLFGRSNEVQQEHLFLLIKVMDYFLQDGRKQRYTFASAVSHDAYASVSCKLGKLASEG